jgi:hypothetical protein
MNKLDKSFYEHEEEEDRFIFRGIEYKLSINEASNKFTLVLKEILNKLRWERTFTFKKLLEEDYSWAIFRNKAYVVECLKGLLISKNLKVEKEGKNVKLSFYSLTQVGPTEIEYDFSLILRESIYIDDEEENSNDMSSQNSSIVESDMEEEEEYESD